MRDHAGDTPFALFLSWGPPHNPYHTAPNQYQRLYRASDIVLRPNVPEDLAKSARRDLAGYYAHCSALDACLGDILETLREKRIQDDTVFVFTSDHGDMLGSQGESRKQRPWDESVLVPFLVRYPAQLGRRGRTVGMPINSADIMPTLLGLCGIDPPRTAEGSDISSLLKSKETPRDGAALIACYTPFGEWTRANGGREYRGVRTSRYTYVRDLNGPWLLYDNREDPYQLKNLCNQSDCSDLQAHLASILDRKLEETTDTFLPGEEYVKRREPSPTSREIRQSGSLVHRP
jgi:arylsulfatase A-like enzyme